MGDFLKYQKLWRVVSGQVTRPVGNTPADLVAQNTWDEMDEQAQGILGLHLSMNLRTHLGATSALSWTALENAFGQPGIATIYADLQAALHVKISGGQNPQVEMQWLLTLFERLRANGMQISDPIQGMMMLCPSGEMGKCRHGLPAGRKCPCKRDLRLSVRRHYGGV